MISNSLAHLTSRKENFVYCTYLNISVCPLTEAASKVKDLHCFLVLHPVQELKYGASKFCSKPVLGMTDDISTPVQALQTVIDLCVLVSDVCLSLIFCLLQFLVIVYNPLARPVNWNIRLPVNGSLYSIVAPNGQAVLNEVGLSFLYSRGYLSSLQSWDRHHLVLCCNT